MEDGKGIPYGKRGDIRIGKRVLHTLLSRYRNAIVTLVSTLTRVNNTDD